MSDVARSAALLEAAGFAVIEPMHPIREVWHLVAHTAQHPGLMLVGVFATSFRDGACAAFAAGTRRRFVGRPTRRCRRR